MPRENQDLQDFQGNVPAAIATTSAKHTNLASKGPDRQSVLKRFDPFFHTKLLRSTFLVVWIIEIEWSCTLVAI